MPATLTLRADSVGKDDTGETVHIEWQGRNDAKMAARMLQYAAWLLGVAAGRGCWAWLLGVAAERRG